MSKFVALRHIPEILPEELAVSGLAPAPYVEQVYDEVSKTQTDVWQLVFSRPDRNGPVLVYKVKIRSQFGYGG